MDALLLLPERCPILVLMPFYMDRHEFNGLTAAGAAAAHLKDLEVRGQFGVRFLTYWFDERAPNCVLAGWRHRALTRSGAVHHASHGFMAYQIIEVDRRMVERFMGKDRGTSSRERPYVETAFRTILFTDIASIRRG